MPALIFDYDGLMVDSERVLAEAIMAALAELGAQVTVLDFGHLFGSTEADEEWERLLAEWCGRPVTLAELEARSSPAVQTLVDRLPLLPGVAELICAARQAGWKVGLATGQARYRLEPRLARLGLGGSFDAVVTSAEVATGKPAPDVFLAVAGRLGVDPGACVVLEDSWPGCEAALAARMSAVLCPSVVSAHCSFPAHVRRVTSLAEITLAELALLVGVP